MAEHKSRALFRDLRQSFETESVSEEEPVQQIAVNDEHEDPYSLHVKEMIETRNGYTDRNNWVQITIKQLDQTV